MDEFSFYGTIGAIILIQISFFWLFRYDHFTRKLSSAYLQTKRLVVLVGTSDHLTNGLDHTEANENYQLVLIEKLRKQLESGSSKFTVVTVLMTSHKREQAEKGQEQQIKMEDGIIHLNSNEMSLYHLRQVVNCIESQLTNLKLHACIDIQQVLPPPLTETRHPFDVLEHLRNYSIPASGLLLALKAQISRDGSRIFFVRDWRYRFANADQHSDDIYWQFFEQFDQNAIDFVNKSEHYQTSPAPIQVNIEQQQQQQQHHPDSTVLGAFKQHFGSRTAIMNSIMALSLLGDFIPKELAVESHAKVETNCDTNNEDGIESRHSSEKSVASVDVIVAKTTELLLLENPRSLTVNV